MTVRIGAVMRKDLKEHRAEMLGTRADKLRALVPLGMFGIFMPVVLGEMLVMPGALPTMAAVMAGSATAARAGDSVAGERDRGTLEMLLTTPLADRDIVLGKIGALVVVGVLGALAAAAAMLPLLTWRHPSGVAAIANQGTLAATLVGAILVSVLVAALGVLVSTFAPSARAAQSRMATGMMTCLFLPLVLLGLLPETALDAVEATARTLRPDLVVLTLTLVVVITDGLLAAMALRRFKRSRVLVP